MGSEGAAREMLKPALHGAGLIAGGGVRARLLVRELAFVDVCGFCAIRPDADLLEKGEAPWTGARQDEFWSGHYLLR